MRTEKIADLLQQVVDRHRLLEHPFYQRWQEGGLSPRELGAYAGQYAHLEACLPEVLSGVVEQLPQGEPRRLASATLADELGNPMSHLELFEDFAVAVGSPVPASATAATEALVLTYRAALEEGPRAVLAVLGAYEVQAAEIAVSKADGLRRHYGIGPEGTRFWDVHGSLEPDHASWSAEAVAQLTVGAADLAAVKAAAERSAVAWWQFLDEREAAAA